MSLMKCCYFFMQLVQFLLKQAGVDKRTGDLYGNRDLLNIARNMARGLKVVQKFVFQECYMKHMAYLLLIRLVICRELRMCTPNTSLFSSKQWKEL